MKKILIFTAMVMALLSSCTTRDIEQEANEQLKVTMREMVKRPDDATLVNVRTVYKCDSLCVLQFTLKGKSALGVDVSLPMEYIYMDFIMDGERMRCETYSNLKPLLPIDWEMGEDEKETAKELAEEGYDFEYIVQHKVKEIKEKYRKKLLEDAPYTEKDPNLEDRLTFSAAWLRMMANGREIQETKGKDVKL